MASSRPPDRARCDSAPRDPRSSSPPRARRRESSTKNTSTANASFDASTICRSSSFAACRALQRLGPITRLLAADVLLHLHLAFTTTRLGGVCDHLSVTDIVDAERRSWMMSRIGPRHTRPELAVRRLVHALGFRFRLHRRDLPGRPDLVLTRHRVVIFVHGCFWHRHRSCSNCTVPKTRPDFWAAKFSANVARDARHALALRQAGWRVVTVWECETERPSSLERRLRRLLTARRGRAS